MATMTRLKRLQRAVKDRILDVLLAQLEDELDAEVADADLPAELVTIPDASHYELAQLPNPGSRILCQQLLITIAQARDTDYTPKLSGNGTIGSMIARLRIVISVYVVTPEGADVERDGRQLGPYEVAETVADVYRGAIMEVMLRDGPDGVAILGVEPYEDFTDSIQDVETGLIIGRSRIEFYITGQGQHPQPQYTI